MKKPSFAPAFVACYPHLCEIARKHHYALTIHGSVGREYYSDFDLVAIPWDDEADDPEIMMKEIWEWAEKHMLPDFKELFKKEYYCQDKPHGRKAWFLQMGNGTGIDISVMPRHTPLKDNEKRDIINTLRDMAIQFYNHQSLPDRICHYIIPFLK